MLESASVGECESGRVQVGGIEVQEGAIAGEVKVQEGYKCGRV